MPLELIPFEDITRVETEPPKVQETPVSQDWYAEAPPKPSPDFLSQLPQRAVSGVTTGLAALGEFAKAMEETRDIPEEMERLTPRQAFEPVGPKPPGAPQMIDHDELNIINEWHQGYIDQFGKDPSEQETKDAIVDYREGKRKVKIQNIQDLINLAPEIPPNYDVGLKGMVNDAVSGMAQFLPTMGVTAVNPIAGVSMTYATLYGLKYSEFIDQGIDPEIAATGATIDAVWETPVEFLGNMMQLGILSRMIKPVGKKVATGVINKAAKAIGQLLKTAGVEGLEEVLQSPGDLLSRVYAANPDAKVSDIVAETIKRLPELMEEAPRTFGVGAIGGGMLGAGGVVAGEGFRAADYAIKKAGVKKVKKRLEPLGLTLMPLEGGGLELRPLEAEVEEPTIGVAKVKEEPVKKEPAKPEPYEAVHYRDKEITTIKGSPLEGREHGYSRTTVRAAKDKATKEYPYVPIGQYYGRGSQPESMLRSKIPHQVALPKSEIYDLVEDPDNLSAKINEARKANPEAHGINIMSKVVQDAGYKGFRHKYNKDIWYATFGEVEVKKVLSKEEGKAFAKPKVVIEDVSAMVKRVPKSLTALITKITSKLPTLKKGSPEFKSLRADLLELNAQVAEVQADITNIDNVRTKIAKGVIKEGTPAYEAAVAKHGNYVEGNTIRHEGSFPVGPATLYGKPTDVPPIAITKTVKHPLNGPTEIEVLYERLPKAQQALFPELEGVKGRTVIDGPIFSKDKAKRAKEIDAIVKRNAQYADWYQEWHDWMSSFDIPKAEAEKHIKIQAILSAGQSPQGNQALYVGVVNALKAGKRKPDKIPGASADQVKKVVAVWTGKDGHIKTLADRIDAYGEKVGAYMHTGLEPQTPDAVVIDRHMPRPWGYNIMWSKDGKHSRFSITDEVRNKITSDIKAAAKRNNMSPGAIQATLWFAIRPATATETERYSEAFKVGPKFVPKLMEEVSKPAKTYAEATKRVGKDMRNILIRDTKAPDNSGRQLLVQISNRLINPKQFQAKLNPENTFNRDLYSKREGYWRPDDFWEIPEWQGMAAGMLPNADVYIVRSIAEAKEFFATSGYDAALFSTQDVTREYIKDIAQAFPGKVVLGGYAPKDFFKDLTNATWYDDIGKAVYDITGKKPELKSDYRHYKGTPTIPRLCMSQGCLHRCAFCSVPKKLDITPTKIINKQLEAFKGLKYKLIYLNDKTFGQAKNYKDLVRVYGIIKAANPDFQGFIIQTTADQMRRFDDTFLKDSGIKFVELGVESYNNKILRALHKPASEKMIDESVEKIRTNNLQFIPNVIVGLAGKGWEETRETYQRTLDFLNRSKDVISHVNPYHLGVIEGTQLAKEVEAKADIDIDEQAVEKSFHKNPEVHKWFDKELMEFAIEVVNKRPGVVITDIEAAKYAPGIYSQVKIKLTKDKTRIFWSRPSTKVSKLKDTKAYSVVDKYGSAKDKPEVVLAGLGDIIWERAARVNVKYGELEAVDKPGVVIDTPEAQKLQSMTDSKRFKDWFKGSKVVDEKGRPLVVYHGTVYDFDAFTTRRRKDANRLGAYFTDLPEAAQRFAGVRGTVIAAYIRMDKPLDLSDIGEADLAKLANAIPGLSSEAINAISGGRWRGGTYTVLEGLDSEYDIVPMLRRKEYDGIIFSHPLEGTTYVAFSPTQIKSVFNKGNWSATDPRISAQRATPQAQVPFTPSPPIGKTLARAADIIPNVPKWLKEAGAPQEVIDRIQLYTTHKIQPGDYGQPFMRSAKDWKAIDKGDTLTPENIAAVTETGYFEETGDPIAFITFATGVQDITQMPRTTYHEYYHIAEKWLLTDKDAARILDHFDGNRESAAEAFADYVKDAKSKTSMAQPNWLRRIWDKMLQIMKGVKKAVMGEGKSTEEIFEKLRKGGYTPHFRGMARLRLAEGKGAQATKRDIKGEAFKKWFKGSKVVDEKGNPLVVYHGRRSKDPYDRFYSERDVTEFKTGKLTVSKRGAWFSDSKDYPKLIGRGHTIPVYLTIKNPLDMRELGIDSTASEVNSFYKRHSISELSAAHEWDTDKIPVYDEPKGGYTDPQGDYNSRIDILYDKYGYDGVILHENEPIKGQPDTTYIPFTDTQIKSVFNRGTWDPTDPNISASKAPQTIAPWSYSALNRIVSTRTDMPGKAQSLPKWLEKFVKPAELKWLGVDQWIAENTKEGKIDKEAFKAWVAANQVVLTEKVLGGMKDREKAKRLEEAISVEDLDWGNVEWIEPDNEWIDERIADIEERFKEDKEEVPDKDTLWEYAMSDWGDFGINQRTVEEETGWEIRFSNDGIYEIFDSTGTYFEQLDYNASLEEAKGRVADNLVEGGITLDYDTIEELREEVEGESTQYGEWVLPGGENYREMLFHVPEEIQAESVYSIAQKVFGMDYADLPEASKKTVRIQQRESERLPEPFTADHFGDLSRSLLMHVRFNERTDAAGDRVLFIEEIQSDSAQQLKKLQMRVDKDGIDSLSEHEKSQYKMLKKFVPFSLTWHEYALKRMLRYAADQGFDSIAWTTGAQQIDRYKEMLRQNVDEIRWSKPSPKVANAAKKALRKELADLEPKHKEALAADDNLGYDGFTWARQAILDNYTPSSASSWEMSAETETLTNKWLELQDKLRALPTEIGAAEVEGTVSIQAFKDDESKFSESVPLEGTATVAGRSNQDLSDIVGGNMAKQIRASSASSGIFKGDDLSIGGQGMKTFYDELMPGFMKKYGKQWGMKVGTANIAGRGGFEVVLDDFKNKWVIRIESEPEVWLPLRKNDTIIKFESRKEAEKYLEGQGADLVKDLAADPILVHRAHLTPEMRESVIYRGQPQFQVKQEAKSGDTQKVRDKVTLARQAFLQPADNPLDKSAVAFLQALESDARVTEALKAYFASMPYIGELHPNQVMRYDEDAQKYIATILTKGGNIKPAIRESGFHAIQKFKEAVELATDISKLSATWSDPTRMMQEADMGHFGGPIQEHILWPARMTILAKLRWMDMMKLKFSSVMESNNITTGKRAKAVGDIIEFISGNDAWGNKVSEIRRMKDVAKVLEAFHPRYQEGIVRAAVESRKLFMNLLDNQNHARKLRKQKEIKYRGFYLPHIIASNLWSKLLGLKVKPDFITASPEMPDFIKPNKPFNPRELAREGGLKNYEKERNIVKLMMDYIESAGKDIFDTNIIHNTKIHTAVLRSVGLENTAEGIDRWSSEVFGGTLPRISKAVREAVPSPVVSAALKLRRNLTRAVFPLNWTWNLFIQTSSAGITYARYGNRANMAGMGYFVSPKMRRAVRKNAYSSIIKSRWGGRAHFQDVQGAITKNKRLQASNIERVEDFLNILTSTIEDTLTGHAVAAARWHGQHKLGLTGRALWEYASEGGAKTQSMYNYGDLPGMLRSKEVTALAPFMTFGFEVFNTVREMNIPILRRLIGKTGAYETTTSDSVQGKALMSKRLGVLARWTAAIIVTNAIGGAAIGRKPWVISSFVPFLGLLAGGLPYIGKYFSTSARGPVPHEFIADFIKGVRSLIVYGDLKRLRRWVLRYQVIGGTQIERTISGIEAVAEGRVANVEGDTLFSLEPSDTLSAVTKGPWRTKPGMEYFKPKAEKTIERKPSKRPRRKRRSRIRR